MLDRKICAICRTEEWGTDAARDIYDEGDQWLCPTADSNGDYAVVTMLNDPPKGCLRIFEQSIASGKSHDS